MKHCQNLDKLSEDAKAIIALTFHNYPYSKAIEVKLDGNVENNLWLGGDLSGPKEVYHNHEISDDDEYLTHIGDKHWAIVYRYDSEWSQIPWATMDKLVNDGYDLFHEFERRSVHKVPVDTDKRQ